MLATFIPGLLQELCESAAWARGGGQAPPLDMAKYNSSLLTLLSSDLQDQDNLNPYPMFFTRWLTCEGEVAQSLAVG